MGQGLLVVVAGGGEQLALRKHCYSFVGTCEAEWETWSLEMNSRSDHGRKLWTCHLKELLARAAWGLVYQRLNLFSTVFAHAEVWKQISVYVLCLQCGSIKTERKGCNRRVYFNTAHVFPLFSLKEIWLPTYYLECCPWNNSGVVIWILLPLLYESTMEQRMTCNLW